MVGTRVLMLAASLLMSLSACDRADRSAATSPSTDNARLSDGSDGRDWPAYGRTYGEQHFSPLTQINTDNVESLGLAWSMDLPAGNSATIPLAIDGTLYFASGMSIVHAVDAASGSLLWKYDPRVVDVAGQKLRQGWGSRGIGYWNGKIYTGTNDGRLIAIDAKSGKPAWSVLTVGRNDGRYITGAPRLFNGKVIIGHGGGDSSDIRGYVTAYDAETGRQLWRFYTVPGNPADGFEDEAQRLAAKTWSGQWWKYGGGGNVWNAFTYDAETDSILLGTGNGAPWNHRIRSSGKGDNLFLCSIVALDANTGKYKWHYQINPGETWDYNASMDIHLANLRIAGTERKVLLQAPKNGFLYVIDRTNGKLISAQKIAKVTWASKIDLATGRPMETPGARFPAGGSFELWPSMQGAHSWMPSAFSPQTGLMYIPVIELGVKYSDKEIGLTDWKRTPGNAYDFGIGFDFNIDDPLQGTTWLVARDPATGKQVWRIRTFGGWNGGVMATAGNLVFQGQVDGQFNAYAADSGRMLWRFPTQAAVVAAPITYQAGGRQYVTVLVGMGTSGGIIGRQLGTVIDYRTQPRRVLTFALGAGAKLPPAPKPDIVPPEDRSYRPNPSAEAAGAVTYGRHCVGCHGGDVVAGGVAPDLRASGMPLSAEAFASVVRGGALVSNGMPRFEEFSDRTLENLRHYIRSRAVAMRAANGGGAAGSRPRM